jgi:hypothetical protein
METEMGRFTKDEMLTELKVIFLFEADHVLISSGYDKAEAFIGFSAVDEGEYVQQSASKVLESASKVDLALFSDITGSFERGYDFAFNRSRLNTFSEEEVQNLQAFMDGTPRTGGVSSAGETHQFMTPDGYCRMVADAAHARWKLEWIADSSQKFTSRELALLANMTDGAVRMAISDKSENRLRAIPGSKPVAVEFDEAKRWLSGRRGFIPWPDHVEDDRFLTRAIRDAETPKALGRLIHQLAGFEAPEKLAEKIGWTAEETKAWFDGNFAFDLERARHLARVLELDVPMFVGKALEVSERTEGGRS